MCATSSEIGAVRVTQIEKKGKLNRRVRLALDIATSSGLSAKANTHNERCQSPRQPLAQIHRNGSPTISARSSWSTPPIICRRRSATPKAEYLAGHIPGAVFFDINAIADTSTDLPHMLPGPDQFGDAVGALGIADTDTIVVYDGIGLYSAPRVWWTFRIFGAKNVFILDGGLPAWKAEGGASRSRRGQAAAAPSSRR